VSWSRYGGDTCIRIARLSGDATVLVRPMMTGGVDGLPAMAGRLVRDGDELCFLPRFAFVDGTSYEVFVDGVEVATLVRSWPDDPPTTEVLAICPTGAVVPRNLLRLYIWFSAPMSEGFAAGHVRLVDDAGEVMPGALLPTQHELWDLERRRLTVLLDPARIKRGLVAHREISYPLETGAEFRIVIDREFRDARGVALRTAAERRYTVDDDQRGRVEPDRWALTIPSRNTTDPLVVAFDRPLDHGLLARCLHVVGPDGRHVGGVGHIGPEERSWRLVPDAPWASGSHELVVDPILEDLAGNSVARVFDRDLTRSTDVPGTNRSTGLAFAPR